MCADQANPFLSTKQRPLILGHRGVPHLHQENSLAGFRRAVALGLDGVELDVFLTRDERVIVFHDEDLERLTGQKGRVADQTWDELRRLRMRRDVFMGRDAQGRDVVKHFDREEPISLLSEVLAALPSRFAVNIELKPPTPRYGERHLGTHVAEVIRQANAVDSVIVTSFDFFKLRALEQAYGAVHSGFAYDDNMAEMLPSWLTSLPEVATELGERDLENRNPESVLHALLDANAIGRWIHSTVVSVEHTLITADTIEGFHRRGMAVGTYTLFPLEMTGVRQSFPDAHHASTVRSLAARGIDWIETDDPERALALLT